MDPERQAAPNVELGHRLLIAAGADQLIQDYAVAAGVDRSVPVANRLLGRYGAGSGASISFDKGFTRGADRELLSLYVPTVVMPKRGKKNAAETQRESEKQFVARRKAHSAVESENNSLEQHRLNRCLDTGLDGSLRYAGLGVLNYNLHVIGWALLRRQAEPSALTPASPVRQKWWCRRRQRIFDGWSRVPEKSARRRASPGLNQPCCLQNQKLPDRN